MQEKKEGSQTAVSRSSVVEVVKLQKYSDAKSQGGMESATCRVDVAQQAQRVGESQCSGGLTSHGSDRGIHVHSGCSSCHSESQDLHHIKKDGAIHPHCTSCVLFHYKGMYCSQCFRVYSGSDQLGDPSLWLTCSNCHRFCHMECAKKAGLPTDSFFFACRYCHHESSAENKQGNASLKRPHMDESSSLSDQETLAAAQIVAIFATKEAKEAKVRARACAAVAAKAAKVAKSALDVAHRAGLEEMRWRLEAHKQTTVGASFTSTMRNLQSGTYPGDVRSQQTAVGLEDKSRQKIFMPPHQRVVRKSFGTVSDISKSAVAANLSHHQRRVLPPVVSADVSASPFAPSHIARKPPQQHSPTGLVVSGQQHVPLSSLPKDQRFTRVSEDVEVEASPERILESLGTPKSDSMAHHNALGRNRVHATNTVEILSDEEAVDDLVDVGDLLAQGFDKEGSGSNLLDGMSGSIDVSGLTEGPSAAENGVEAGVGGANTGQPPGGMLEVNAVSSLSGTPLELKVSESVTDLISLP